MRSDGIECDEDTLKPGLGTDCDPRFAGAVVLCLLAACARPADSRAELPDAIALHWTRPSSESMVDVDRPPDKIMIRWRSGVGPGRDDVAYLAERHCLAWNAHAAETRELVSGDARLAEFVCRDSR